MKRFVLCLSLLSLSACSREQEFPMADIIAGHHETCEDYGVAKGAPEMVECVQYEAARRKAAARVLYVY